MIFSLGDKKLTTIGDEHFIAETASVVGDVTLHNQVSIWFNTVLRAEHEPIVIGEQSNIQDGAVLHVDPGFPLSIGRQVTVAHKAMVHGCSVGDYSLIGINAVVLNGAKIGKYCLIGANALVTENMEVPDYSLVLGSPGKIKKTLSKEDASGLEISAATYVANLKMYNQLLQRQD